MALNRFTPVPPIESDAETDSKELQSEIDEWKIQLTALNDEENYEDEVRYAHIE